MTGPTGTYFFDLDGTLFKHGTTEPLPGALDTLQHLIEYGFRIIFMTHRGDAEFAGHPVFGEAATREMLKQHGLDSHTVIFDVQSPRTFVDDSKMVLVRRALNEPYAGSVNPIDPYDNFAPNS